jgi:hypothetical protein
VIFIIAAKTIKPDSTLMGAERLVTQQTENRNFKKKERAMKSIYRFTGIFMTVAAILALSRTAGFAEIAPQGIFPDTDVILLSENHIRKVAFDLNGIAGSGGSIHSIFILGGVLNTSNPPEVLTIYMAFNSPLTKGDEVLYLVTGFVYTPLSATPTPLLQYIYASGGTYGVSIPVSKFVFGALFVSAVYAKGVEFPITMLGTVVLAPPAS